MRRKSEVVNVALCSTETLCYTVHNSGAGVQTAGLGLGLQYYVKEMIGLSPGSDLDMV